MTVTVKALTEFQHGYHRGRLDAVTGGEYRLPGGEADELVKAGLAELVAAPTEAPAELVAAPTEAPAEENLDDLVGGEKMADEAENKMAPAPTNKKAR